MSYRSLLLLCGGVMALWQPLSAQSEDKDLQKLDRRIGNLIRSIDEIKWQYISIYHLEDEFKSFLLKRQQAEDSLDLVQIDMVGQTLCDEPLPAPNFRDNMLQWVASARTKKGRDIPAVKKLIAQTYQQCDEESLDDAQVTTAVSLAVGINSKRGNRPKDFYLVSSREKDSPRLIALLGVRTDETTGNPVMMGSPIVGRDLYSYLTSNGPDSVIYSDLKQAIAENGQGLSNQTSNLRDLSEIIIAPRTNARAIYLDENQYGYVLTAISSGRPLRGEYKPTDTTGEESGGGGIFGGTGESEMFADNNTNSAGTVKGAEIPGTAEYPYELSVGTDVIASFMSYKLLNNKVPEPNWGVELRNNFDEINDPSIWGGRLTLNAILENIKIGAVLPQPLFRGTSIATSGIGSRTMKILGGYGLAMSGDFAAPVLDNSGLFNFYGSYTFSEANSNNLIPTFNEDFSRNANPDKGYLIRYAGQAYYSFGFYADADAKHLFRLKIGGTVYGVDAFQRDTVNEAGSGSEPTYTTKLKKLEGESKTVGGVSAKIEYMKGGQKIPYGASLQYNDQSILADVWLQFIVSQSLDLKFGFKYFTPVFDANRLESHPWENPNYVVPSVSVRYHF
jgi:hypothetical protein